MQMRWDRWVEMLKIEKEVWEVRCRCVVGCLFWLCRSGQCNLQYPLDTPKLNILAP